PGTLVRSLELRDTGSAVLRAVTRVESSHPDWLQVRLVRPADGPREPRDRPPARVVATAEIEITTTGVLGTLRGEVRVYVGEDASRPALTVRVRATRVARVQVSPSRLVLPRSVDGQDCYSVSCICRATDGVITALATAEAPECLTVTYAATS